MKFIYENGKTEDISLSSPLRDTYFVPKPLEPLLSYSMEAATFPTPISSTRFLLTTNQEGKPIYVEDSLYWRTN